MTMVGRANARATRRFFTYFSSVAIYCVLINGCDQPTPPESPPVETVPQPVEPTEQSPSPPPPAQSDSLETSPVLPEAAPPPMPVGETPRQPDGAILPEKKPSPPVKSKSSGATGDGSQADSANRQSAKRRLELAKSKSQSGDHAGAFLEAREAWDLISESQDPSSQQLAEEIQGELRSLAEKLSPGRRPPSDQFKPLILK